MLIKRTINLVLILAVLAAEVREIRCSCPSLNPNANVHARCSKNNQEYLCSNNETSNRTKDNKVPRNTVAEYKCDRYFKSNNNNKGGRLTCMEDGTWRSYKAFKEFHCEPDCGKSPVPRNGLIRNGSSTNPETWPWIATIFRLDPDDGRFKYVCGGTLIGQRTVLTAAHCIANGLGITLPTNIYKLFLGTISSKFEENLMGGLQMHSIKEIHIHPNYDPRPFIADIAVLLLQEPLKLSDSVLPICLPQNQTRELSLLSSGNFGHIASFGVDQTGQPSASLQYTKFPITSSVRCKDVINIIPHDNQYCAGDPNGPNLCSGDSGSGMVFKLVDRDEEKSYVYGIVSFTGKLTNECGPMTLFTRVFSHIRWIKETLIYLSEMDDTMRETNHEVSESQQPKPTTKRIYTNAEKEALSKIADMVGNILLEDYMHKDEYLIRFLRTNKLNLKETKEMLQATMHWRTANNIKEITEEDFAEFRKEYPIFYIGFDKKGRPVSVQETGSWDITKVLNLPGGLEKFRRYNLRNMELTEERIREVGAPNITQTVAIFDLHGWDIWKTLCASCLDVMSSVGRLYEFHYPEQAHKVFVINAPFFIERVGKNIIPFLWPTSLDGVHFYGTNKAEWSQALLEQIPADQLLQAYGGTMSNEEGKKRIL